MDPIHVASVSAGKAVYDEARFRELYDQGLLPPDAYYWKEGMADWRPVAEYFQAIAPPAALLEPLDDPQAAAKPARTSSRRITWAILAAFAIAFLGAAMIYDNMRSSARRTAALDHQQQMQAVEVMSRELERLGELNYDESGRLIVPERPAESGAQPSGELAEVARWLQQRVDRLVGLQNAYTGELMAMKWDTVLAVDRLREDADASATKAMVAKARGIARKYERLSLKQLAEEREHVQHLNISAASRREIERGMDQFMARARANLEEAWGLEQQVLEQFEGIALLLQESRGWVVDDEQILFQGDEEAEKFNTLMQRIDELVEQQEAARRRSLTEGASKLELMRQNLGR